MDQNNRVYDEALLMFTTMMKSILIAIAKACERVPVSIEVYVIKYRLLRYPQLASTNDMGPNKFTIGVAGFEGQYTLRTDARKFEHSKVSVIFDERVRDPQWIVNLGPY